MIATPGISMIVTGGDTVTRIERLKHNARASASFRGHRLGRFEQHDWRAYYWVAHCLRCGRGVVVIAKPFPNEIEIAGEAVGMNCAD